MTAPDRPGSWLLLGSPSGPEPSVRLETGRLSLELVGGSIRTVRIGPVTVLEQVYIAVRDESWNTIPGRITSREIINGPVGFRVRILSEHRFGAIDMSCDTTVEGGPDGSLHAAIDATANTSFAYARVGLNLVHPARQHVGRSYRAVGPTGAREAVFPARVEPQPVREGHEIALIRSFSALTIELDGVTAQFAFEGDLFETEDQRNFGDASFKTFAPPLDRPIPLWARPGDVIHQAFDLDVRMTSRPHALRARWKSTRGDIIVRNRATGRLPSIGLVAASHGRTLTPGEAGRVRQVGPAFLRVVLGLTDEAPTLAGLTDAAALGVPVELAVEAPEDAGAAQSLRERSRSVIGHHAMVRAIVTAGASSPRADELPDAEQIQMVRNVLSDHRDVPIVAAGRTYFADANRGGLLPTSVDGLAFPYSPTVHVWDDEWLFANLTVLPLLVRQAIEIAGGRPVHVGPISMATRSGPFPRGPLGAGSLPGSVDPRQLSILGAAWTVATVAAATSGGATSLTMYETTGWLGVSELDSGSQNPEAFPSAPAALFPLGYALAAILEHPRASVLEVRMESDGLAAMALRAGPTERVVLANLCPEEREVAIAGLGGGTSYLRSIERTTGGTLSNPAPLRATGSHTIRVLLGPYGVAVIGRNG